MRFVHRMIRWTLSAASASAVLAVATGALASQEYPQLIAERLGMDCPPPCTICHRDMRGGIGTADRPFADAMEEAGLLGLNPDTVPEALDKLEGKGSGGTGGSGGSSGSGGSGGSGGSAGSAAGAAGMAGMAGQAGGAGMAGAAGASSGTGGTSGTGGASGTGGTSSGGVVDTDGDGMGDVEELRNNRDPNVAGKEINCGPQYGCGARVEPRGDLDGYALIAALGMAFGLIWLGRRPR